MALLCCFLLIVERISIVECERLYELTWSRAQSEGSKWPPGRRGRRSAAAPRADAGSSGEGRGRAFQAFCKAVACFELVGPRDRLGRSGEEGRGDPDREGRGEAGRPGAPPRPQPRPRPGGPAGARCGAVGSRALSPGLSRVEPGAANLRDARECRAGGRAGGATGRAAPEGELQTPARASSSFV